MKSKNIKVTAKEVAEHLTFNGKPTTKKELLANDFTEEEILNALRNRVSHQPYSHLKKGLVMQWQDGGWHGVYVIVKTNERFVWVKRWDDLKNDKVKPRRILRYKVRDEGFSTQHVGYASSSKGSKHIGKIIDL